MESRLFLEQFGHLAQSPGGAQKLRELILELAVRGKLVPQDPNDEPASELLRCIEAEKQRLMNVSKHKIPPQHLQLADEEKSYELPNGWEWIRLSNIYFELQNGLSKRSGTQGKPFIVLRLANIRNGQTLNLSDTRTICLTEAEFDKYSLSKGDIIVIRVNGSKRLVGNLIPFMENIKSAYSDHLIRMKIYPSEDLQKYLCFYSWTKSAREHIRKNTITTAGQNTINQVGLSSLPIPLPPLAEQHRIVAKVDELMQLCDQLEAEQIHHKSLRESVTKSTLYHLANASTKAETLTYWNQTKQHFAELFNRPTTIEELRATILQLAVQGKLVPQDPNDEPASELLKRIEERELRKNKVIPLMKEFENFSELSEGWEWVSLEKLAIKITDGEHFRPKTVTTGVFFLSAKDIREHGIQFDNPLYVTTEDAQKFWQRCNPERNDILIVSRGATVGRTCLVNTDEKFCLLGSVILVKPVSLISSKYLLYVLRSPLIYQQLISVSGATAQQAIYIRDIKGTNIPLPPLAEQHRIVAKVDELMGLCDQLERQAIETQSLSARLMDSVIYHLFESVSQVEA